MIGRGIIILSSRLQTSSFRFTGCVCGGGAGREELCSPVLFTAEVQSRQPMVLATPHSGLLCLYGSAVWTDSPGKVPVCSRRSVCPAGPAPPPSTPPLYFVAHPSLSPFTPQRAEACSVLSHLKKKFLYVYKHTNMPRLPSTSCSKLLPAPWVLPGWFSTSKLHLSQSLALLLDLHMCTYRGACIHARLDTAGLGW